MEIIKDKLKRGVITNETELLMPPGWEIIKKVGDLHLSEIGGNHAGDSNS